MFGTHDQFRGNSTELEWQTSYAMQGKQTHPFPETIEQQRADVNYHSNHDTAFWVSFAADPSVDPRNHLGQAWPKYTATDGQIMVLGNATGPSASYVAPVAVADKYSGSC